MKKINIILLTLIVVLSSCNPKWDKYFFSTSNMDENTEITVAEYIAANPEYSQFKSMLESTGLDKELIKNQEITVWVVNNDGMTASGVQPNDTMRMQYHINNLPYLRTSLKNGLRIRSLNGVYFQITERNDSVFTNSSLVVKSIRLKDGVVHEIRSLMKTQMNIYDYLKKLGDEYSTIRDTIFKFNVERFDKANSIPIGVDLTGNTIYDSVFYIYNPIFDKVPFNSEFQQFTIMLPSNEVIDSCFSRLKTSFTKMGRVLTQADSTTAWTWLKQAVFYNGKIMDLSPVDLISSYGKTWRTTIQKVDLTNPMEMSNGVIYNVTKLKIPNNVMITRIKSLVHYWEYQDASTKFPNEGDLYTFKGTTSVKIPVPGPSEKTPNPNVLPYYYVLDVLGDATTDEFSVEFVPLERYKDETGAYKVRVMEVPTGEYLLYMGFQSAKHPYLYFYFNGVQMGEERQVSGSNPWNFDRVNETTDGIAKWNGLGGKIGTVNVTRPDGEDGLASFKVKVQFSKIETGGAKRFKIYHWALKPTANNY